MRVEESLYPIEPREKGTPYVESFASYISRLAKAHRVRSSDILTYLQPNPPEGTPYEKKKDDHWLGRKNAHLINGQTYVATLFSDSLKKRPLLMILFVYRWQGGLTFFAALLLQMRSGHGVQYASTSGVKPLVSCLMTLLYGAFV